ncbi:N-acetylmuramoyl-L-alanine amidase [Dyella silvatica]|uniref:N-acetylmuramoyl-L-alanine amidase n=1 Tax=Dyella silvatica TaxID=2992128 RepID=UPI002258FD41|nr:N-acetylmuramoyl-L-alanine amidase [Dyella silvatica]
MTRDSEDIGAVELAAAHRRQGYSQIGVHYVIRRNGVVETGRPTSLPGAMSHDMNHRAIQVCLIGGLTDLLEPYGSFTAAQLEALRDVHESLEIAGSDVLAIHYGPEAPLKTIR